MWTTVQALARALGVSCQAFDDFQGEPAEDAEESPAALPPPNRRRRKDADE